MAKCRLNGDETILARLSALETRMTNAEARGDETDAKLEGLGRQVKGLFRSIIRILGNRDKRTDVLEAAIAPTSGTRRLSVQKQDGQVVSMRRRGGSN